MKREKQGNTPPKTGRQEPLKALKKYFSNEVTLIHEDLDELKSFLTRHSALPADHELNTDARRVDDYFNSANDLFRQIALEGDKDLPLEAKCYETFILRKKKKKTSPSSGDQR